MKRVLKFITCFALLSSLIYSCQRQELSNLSSRSNKATIRFTFDWGQSGIEKDDLHNISMYAYPDDGGDPYLNVSGNIESSSIHLPVGNYSLLIFNDVVGNIEGTELLGVNSYDNIRAVVIERAMSNNLYYTFEEDEVVVADHKPMAAWRMEELEVTEEMVSCGYCGEEYLDDQELWIDVEPTPITTPCMVTMRIENLNNANIIKAMIRGLASGVYLVSEQRIKTSENINLYNINFTKRTYDTDGVNGVVDSQITTFGKSPYEAEVYEMEISIILNSGELMTFTRDITEQIQGQSNLKIVITLDSDENIITLPKGIGTGFGVEDWGDRTTVELQ